MTTQEERDEAWDELFASLRRVRDMMIEDNGGRAWKPDDPWMTDMIRHIDGLVGRWDPDASAEETAVADEYWDRQLKTRTNAVVIDGVHYRIVSDLQPGEVGFAGHGGQQFSIRMLETGDTVTTRNLWYQGPVPPEYRDRMPDTAEFVHVQEEVNNGREDE